MISSHAARVFLSRALQQGLPACAANLPADRWPLHCSLARGCAYSATPKSPLLRPLDLDVPKSVSELVPPLENRTSTKDSLRTGLIGIKAGMVSEWDEYGVLTPFTVIWFDENQVTQVKVRPFDCTTSLQIGCGSKKAKQLHPQQQIFYCKQQLPFKSKLVEFKVSPDALMPVGTRLGADHFVPGQHVDVTAATKGKGFAGTMKRWGFKGMPRTHGTTLSHRAPGAIGTQGASRVFPGKKMAGRMGTRRNLQRNVWVYRVDPERNLLWLKGSVQGPQGAFVYVRDALWKRDKELPDLPFPTNLSDSKQPTQATPKKNMYDDFKL